MKTILIETVSNGWIVRPFEPCDAWATQSRPNIAVYNSMDELQADIPKLLEFLPESYRQKTEPKTPVGKITHSDVP
jgi:hypothetical protein